MEFEIFGKTINISKKVLLCIGIVLVSILLHFSGFGVDSASEMTAISKVQSNPILTASTIVPTMEEVRNEQLVAEASPQATVVSSQSEDAKIRVYVCGKVKNPGVYELEKGSLIIDAVNCAGGFDKHAYKKFNLAASIKDNCMLTIPRKASELEKVCCYSIDNASHDNASQKLVGKMKKDKSEKQKVGNSVSSAAFGEQKEDKLININTASLSKLQELNGVGEVIAKRIIDYRKITKFNTIEDIQNVGGIGEKTYQELKDYICTK